MNIKASSARKLRRFRVYCEGVFTAETQRGEAAAKKGKANFTTKGREEHEVYNQKNPNPSWPS